MYYKPIAPLFSFVFLFFLVETSGEVRLDGIIYEKVSLRRNVSTSLDYPPLIFTNLELNGLLSIYLESSTGLGIKLESVVRHMVKSVKGAALARTKCDGEPPRTVNTVHLRRKTLPSIHTYTFVCSGYCYALWCVMAKIGGVTVFQ